MKHIQYPIETNIISSGSHGNAVIYFGEILIDVGVNYNVLEPYLKNIKIILLTHIHGDHFKKNAIKKIAQNYPNIVFGIPEHMRDYISDLGIRKKGLLKNDIPYKIGIYEIIPVPLVHNVPNSGYKIHTDYKMFHATDTGSLNHIKAEGYDLYAIEHNHDKYMIERDIERKIQDNVYAYEIDSSVYHLSFQEAYKWISKNRKESSQVIMLHISSKYLIGGK